MSTAEVVVTITSFLLTILLIMWRPWGMSEAIPAVGGAVLTIASGSVSLQDLRIITSDVGGAAVTILATITMAVVLESFGVFRVVADFLVRLSKNSGIRLFWYINLMSLLVTLLFNNDGGIIIATPILLIVLRELGLKPHQQIPYLLSGALIDTAASAPIGVSNIVNLISLKIVGMNVIEYTSMMFVPALLGLVVLALLNYLVLRKELVRDLSKDSVQKHPPHSQHLHPQHPRHQERIKHPRHMNGLKHRGHLFPNHHYAHLWQGRSTAAAAREGSAGEPSGEPRLIRAVLLYVLGVRVALFAGAYFGVPVSVTAVVGAVILLVWRWMKMRMPPTDILRKTPWHVLLFAFGLYIVVYGVHKIGLTAWLMTKMEPLVGDGKWLIAITAMAVLVSIMSNIFNNHPALMIGTLTLTSMHLNPMTLKVAYLGNIIGSDIGSLLMPIGLLATLLWMYILKQHHVHISWHRYIRLTAVVIPITVAVTIFLVYGWVHLIF